MEDFIKYDLMVYGDSTEIEFLSSYSDRCFKFSPVDEVDLQVKLETSGFNDTSERI